MPQISIVLDPRLGVDPDEFLTAWFADPKSRAAGVAAIPDDREARDFDLGIVVQIVIDLAVGVSGAALYDLLRAAGRRVAQRQVTVAEVGNRDDGSQVVMVAEEGKEPQ